ncbi:hypothetical protein [Burkholderia thailandensis]|uniref:hypothetical protein n=1 Tax=Burkholderia thailandensis TaxID=57975 RepID=UPI0003ECAD9A|nr:hypothetical protein [Burkholderia thailandensis]AHI68216.1 hypothetical protein BTL_4474 [Burkholderia thailandensis H0587]AOJ54229.1 hypothetical protein AQ475_26020 [Burkholderia thailandensis]AVR27615.1 hypothetical protein A8H32_21565 [Burkholderia thailandensis]MCZ2893248.1 hypothetical protein [Burkholderia thailandensis]
MKPSLIERLIGVAQRLERRSRTMPSGSAAFARCTAETIAEEALPHVALGPLLRECLSKGPLPIQRRIDEAFGQPALTLYRTRRFTVDLLFWQEASTGIHQHEFAGAFSVLCGSSLHTRFTFEHRSDLDRSMRLGVLALQSTELLREGDVREIVPGRRLIHSLFHLDTPSVTLAIRSLPSARRSPEYEYLPPGLAFDPRARSEAQLMHKRLLALCQRFERAQLERNLRELIVTTDLYGAFLLLGQARGALIDDERAYRRVVSSARSVHGGDTVNALVPAIEEQWRRQAILSLRRTVVDFEQRLFLALVLNLPERAAILSLLDALDSNQSAIERILRVVRDLSAYDWMGLRYDATVERMLRDVLEGRPPSAILGQLRRLDNPAPVECSWMSMRASPVLRPLFL